jgi:hypothetical protein
MTYTDGLAEHTAAHREQMVLDLKTAREELEEAKSGPDPGSWTRLNPAVLLEEARRSAHGQEELHRRVPSAGR